MADQTAQYIFMHKDIPVAEFGLDTATGAIVSIGQVYEPRHVPVGIPVRKGSVDRGALNEWWRGRSIPASRSGIREALRELRISDSRILAEKCLGLSLSDQYWICPVDSGISWGQLLFMTAGPHFGLTNLQDWSGRKQPANRLKTVMRSRSSW